MKRLILIVFVLFNFFSNGQYVIPYIDGKIIYNNGINVIDKNYYPIKTSAIFYLDTKTSVFDVKIGCDEMSYIKTAIDQFNNVVLNQEDINSRPIKKRQGIEFDSINDYLLFSKRIVLDTNNIISFNVNTTNIKKNQSILASPNGLSVYIQNNILFYRVWKDDGTSNSTVYWNLTGVVFTLRSFNVVFVRNNLSVSLYIDNNLISTKNLTNNYKTEFVSISQTGAYAFNGFLNKIIFYKNTFVDINNLYSYCKPVYTDRIGIEHTKINFVGVLRMIKEDDEPKKDVVSAGPAFVDWGNGYEEIIYDTGIGLSHEPIENLSYNYETSYNRKIWIWLKDWKEIGKIDINTNSVNKIVGFKNLTECYTWKLWNNPLNVNISNVLIQANTTWVAYTFISCGLTGDLGYISNFNNIEFAYFAFNNLNNYTQSTLYGEEWNGISIRIEGNTLLSASMISQFIIDLDTGNGTEAIDGSLIATGCNGGSMKYTDLTPTAQIAYDNMVNNKNWVITLDQ